MDFFNNLCLTKDSINKLLNLVKMIILGIETSCDETRNISYPP